MGFLFSTKSRASVYPAEKLLPSLNQKSFSACPLSQKPLSDILLKIPTHYSSAPIANKKAPSRKATGSTKASSLAPVAPHLNPPLQPIRAVLYPDLEDEIEPIPSNDLISSPEMGPQRTDSSELLTAPFATRRIPEPPIKLGWDVNAQLTSEIQSAENCSELADGESVDVMEFGKQKAGLENGGMRCRKCKKETKVNDRVTGRCDHTFHLECVADRKLCPICNQVLENIFVLDFK